MGRGVRREAGVLRHFFGQATTRKGKNSVWDVAVVGGGMIGAALAQALGESHSVAGVIHCSVGSLTVRASCNATATFSQCVRPPVDAFCVGTVQLPIRGPPV